MKFDRVEDAIEELKKGKLVIIVDDIKRENEGDFVGAGIKTTPETINFMIKNARGAFIAAFCEYGRCEELGILPQRTMVENTETNRTQMMVSVDAKKASSGSSAYDRALTINILSHPDAEPDDLRKPGHVIPIQASPEGLKEREGHTEAGVELVKLAGFRPAVAVDLEILNDQGKMASRQELFYLAKKFNLRIVSIEQIKDFLNRRK
jgi:3,4-dihydroxy 2-butanone 4-phosphate synthase/GTP cyclohydrolase II